MGTRKNSVALASMGLGLVAALSLLLLSTCQKDGGTSRQGSGSEDATALSGTWSSGCKPDPAKAGYYFNDTRTFEGSTFSTSFESFTDEDCTSSLMAQTQTGAFVIGDALEGSAATELDITIGAISIVLHSDTLVQSYNAKKFCGGGWENGTVRTITRAACGGGEGEDVVYEIFEARDDGLYFGKKDSAHTGKSESQRPAVIDESRPFTRS
jgi:hypothetical protein